MKKRPFGDLRFGSTSLSAAVFIALAIALAVGSACTNNPYPDADDERKVLYAEFGEAPKTLDPVRAYTTAAHQITGNVYDTLLEYHYLERPYRLIPGLAKEVPTAENLDDGKVRYRFELRSGVRYAPDPCFELGGAGRDTRIATTADISFELHRIADERKLSPVAGPFSNIVGFAEFRVRLGERVTAGKSANEAKKAGDAYDEDALRFHQLPAHEQYQAVGLIDGIETPDDRTLTVTLQKAYPQILYWFGMPFTTPVPWEAVQYYDGEQGRRSLADHPVGTGPYQLAFYNKQARMVLERNPYWYGSEHPGAPGATYPSTGEASDSARGRLDPAIIGQPLPFIERIEFIREKESIPAFTKFLQGYYDASGIIRESFDSIVKNGALSPQMSARGVTLEKSISTDVFYIGFNMDDAVVGTADGDRSRKLRQAMSQAVDVEEFSRLFMNGRGVPAQSPLPPGIFGYDPEYVNPYRIFDIERAKASLVEAGYPGGIDSKTGKPLTLTFDSGDPSVQGKLRVQFYLDSWRRIGLDVTLSATTYNQLQEKVNTGRHQIFQWGWVADYPDPENFLFLLWSEMGRSQNEGPNSANFGDATYDELFLAMKDLPNSPERLELIEQMRSILEEQRPWIELFHRETFGLYQPWLRQVKPFGMSYPMAKYRDIDTAERTRLRAEWNEPVRWPVYVMFALLIAIVVPGIRTFFQERQ